MIGLLKMVPGKVWVAVGLAIALAGWTAAVYRKGGDAPRAQIAAMQQAAARQALHDLRNKERTDAEHSRRTAALNRELARLRQRPEFVATPAPAASRCPEDQVCYDRAEFERAYRALARGVREVAGEGTQVTIDLDAARDWAHGD